MAMSKTKKVRNYSFQNSRRLPVDKMTEICGVKIPSMAGSCYHAIMCALAENKNKFCNWEKVIQLTEQYMRKYGGNAGWDKFVSKSGVKGYKQRVKDNTHTLTRTGKDCYGYRLHERGMCIYYFKDGAMLLTGGNLVKKGANYDVAFDDGMRLQTRYRGTTMTYAEYKKFLELKYIDNTGKILNHEAIKDYRMGIQETPSTTLQTQPVPATVTQVCITLEESSDQSTADRLESLGLVVEQALENEIIGTIPSEKIGDLRNDKDVVDVDVLEGVV